MTCDSTYCTKIATKKLYILLLAQDRIIARSFCDDCYNMRIRHDGYHTEPPELELLTRILTCGPVTNG